ncbi:MAG: type II toxin-antitoxin system VapC family toxin [Archaeoglobus sp.]|nr:type II toxin-antitoxin system VapC family toxin [Archaeoglobus sp.]
MIFDTSIVLQILKNRDFYRDLREIVDEDVKITSITAYELLKGAIFVRLTRHSDREMNVIMSLLSEISVLPFGSEENRIASYIWAMLKEKGVSINDADIMISSICIGAKEKLITLDRDFEKIKGVYEGFEVEILEMS